MKTIAASRARFWQLLAVPGSWILYRWIASPELYGYGHAIRDSGDWAAWLLIATLAVTSIRRLFSPQRWSAWLMRHRRDLGVASFAYALGHTLIYLGNKADLAAILADLRAPDILAGWLALAVFVPLAATSNDLASRALKRSWKRIHRLVYPAAALTFLHWVLAAYDPTVAYIHIAILIAIELVRIWPRRQRVT